MSELNIFDEQLNTRKTGDEMMLEGAFDDLMSILHKNATLREGVVTDAIGCVLLHLGLKIPDVPDELTDIDQRIEYMLRPSGCMKRRVELTGAW